MVHYKLTYFNIKGRAEPIRVILAYTGVEYEDYRFDKKDLAKLKPQFPWGQVPVLQVDDFVLAQTGAICRFLAHRFHLTGETDWEAAKCDELVNATEDFRGIWKKTAHARITDPIVLGQAKKDFIDNHVPKYMEKLISIKTQNEGLWLVGKNPTWADLYIAAILESIEEAVDPNVLDSYPVVKSWKKNVYSLPKVKEYIESR